MAALRISSPDNCRDGLPPRWTVWTLRRCHWKKSSALWRNFGSLVLLTHQGWSVRPSTAIYCERPSNDMTPDRNNPLNGPRPSGSCANTTSEVADNPVDHPESSAQPRSGAAGAPLKGRILMALRRSPLADVDPNFQRMMRASFRTRSAHFNGALLGTSQDHQNPAVDGQRLSRTAPIPNRLRALHPFGGSNPSLSATLLIKTIGCAENPAHPSLYLLRETRWSRWISVRASGMLTSQEFQPITATHGRY